MTGTWRRTKYALHETLFTHRDSGGETLATWRLGSAYSAAFLANQWRPDRVNTTGLSLREGTTQLGFDALGNLRREFWPDIRKKLRR
jgi:YD repeat-containing protein